MSNFTPLVEKEYEFEGDTIKARFARLKRKHMLRAIPAMQKVAEDFVDPDAVDLKKINLASMSELLDEVVDVIPEYMSEFSGLKDSNGNPVTIQTVVDDFYFAKLSINIAMDMIKESTPLASKNG